MALNFDYYHGGEAEQSCFYRIPRVLITHAYFKCLSTDSKLLYGLLLDRMGLSLKNKWMDERGRVFIYYSREEIQEDLCCGRDKAAKLLAELDTEKGIGLIECVKRGQGRPTIIYVKRFTVPEPVQEEPPPSDPDDSDAGEPEIQTTENQESGPQPPNARKQGLPAAETSSASPQSQTDAAPGGETGVQTTENQASRGLKISSQDCGKTAPSYIYSSQPYPSQSYPSPSMPPGGGRRSGSGAEWS